MNEKLSPEMVQEVTQSLTSMFDKANPAFRDACGMGVCKGDNQIGADPFLAAVIRDIPLLPVWQPQRRAGVEVVWGMGLCRKPNGENNTMSSRKFTVRQGATIEPCPACGQKTSFTAHSVQSSEDCCDVWIVCECGHDPHGTGDRLESVMGALDEGNVGMAIDCWNMAVIERRRAGE
jgi:hypothetical protein